MKWIEIIELRSTGNIWKQLETHLQEFINQAEKKAGSQTAKLYTRVMIDTDIRRSKDPFNNFLKFLGPRNEWFFPCPPWEKELVDIGNGVGWKQTKCPYFDFSKKENALEVTRAYCDFDRKVAAQLSDHVELRREKTLAKGNSYCDFLYYKK